jgi:hypothetical protein
VENNQRCLSFVCSFGLSDAEASVRSLSTRANGCAQPTRTQGPASPILSATLALIILLPIRSNRVFSH